MKDEGVALKMWMFDCPIHGTEMAVFCFRAFDDDNEGRWKKVSLEGKDLGASEWEIHDMLVDLRERAR